MEPWVRMLSPFLSLRLPASGDVSMDYNPWTNWGVASPSAGSPEVEAGVFREVAMPGKQLGKLTEALTAVIDIVEAEQNDLAARYPEQAACFAELRSLAADIGHKKEQLKKSAKAEAEEALERLKNADADAYASLLSELRGQGAR